MSSCLRVSKLFNPNIIIRLANCDHEIEAANRLVYRNYVNLYWPEDEEVFRRNKYLHLPERHAFVAADGNRIIGTMSIITDSSSGLPSDGFRPDILQCFRESNECVGEATLFAVDQCVQRPMNLILYLYKFMLQYSFYYLDLDRLVASCRPKHADFYESVLCFDKLAPPAPYGYAGDVECQFVTLPLLEAHLRLSRRYFGSKKCESNFYRFLFVDSHPNVQLPDCELLHRNPSINWVAVAQRIDLSIAV